MRTIFSNIEKIKNTSFAILLYFLAFIKAILPNKSETIGNNVK